MYGLYIHWPFCQSKCRYCDFASYDKDFDKMGSLAQRMGEELDFYLQNHKDISLDTVYFGGGTPSIMPLPVLSLFMEKIKPYFIFESEVSIEINPASSSELKLKEYKQLGINRVSFGVQSFDDNVLKILGRLHSSQQAIESYHLARSIFDNINIDLMFGTPGQTVDILNNDLDTIIRLDPEHVSIYSLILEDGTPFWDSYNKKELVLPDEDTVADMYSLIIDRLTDAGYVQYEVSNFAKPGRECRHNYNCWLNREYIGIGVGAHSFFAGARYANPDAIADYLQSDNSAITSNIGKNKLSDKDNVSNKLVLGLRKLDGVCVDAQMRGYFGDEIDKLISLGLLEIKDNNIKLTRRGLFVGNEVFERFVD